jgi:hypothetical protein
MAKGLVCGADGCKELDVGEDEHALMAARMQALLAQMHHQQYQQVMAADTTAQAARGPSILYTNHTNPGAWITSGEMPSDD